MEAPEQIWSAQRGSCARFVALEEGEKSEETARTSRQFNLTSASLAFVLWGGWAFLVNRASEEGAAPWVSAGTQGTASFLITLGMVQGVTWLFHRLPNHPARLVLPAAFIVLLTGSCLFLVHSLVGTANTLGTIAPALTVAFLFNCFTAAKLRRVQRERNSS